MSRGYDHFGGAEDREDYDRQRQEENYQQQYQEEQREQQEQEQRNQQRRDAELECAYIDNQIACLQDQIDNLKNRQYEIMQNF